MSSTFFSKQKEQKECHSPLSSYSSLAGGSAPSAGPALLCRRCFLASFACDLPGFPSSASLGCGFAASGLGLALFDGSLCLLSLGDFLHRLSSGALGSRARARAGARARFRAGSGTRSGPRFGTRPRTGSRASTGSRLPRNCLAGWRWRPLAKLEWAATFDESFSFHAAGQGDLHLQRSNSFCPRLWFQEGQNSLSTRSLPVLQGSNGIVDSLVCKGRALGWSLASCPLFLGYNCSLSTTADFGHLWNVLANFFAERKKLRPNSTASCGKWLVSQGTRHRHNCHLVN